MRDLRLRAWDKKKEGWSFGGEHHGSMIYSDDVEFSAPSNVDYSLCELSVFFGHISGEGDENRFILMQYTGLKDRLGKEIYEGDIVKKGDGDSVYIEYDGFSWLETLIGYPDNVEERAAIIELVENPQDKYGYMINPLNTWEVIGNIYENPELLK